jgi:hypothetical protein
MLEYNADQSQMDFFLSRNNCRLDVYSRRLVPISLMYYTSSSKYVGSRQYAAQ